MVLVQKWRFLQLFFLGNLEQENVFYDILERKNSFLRYKKKKFKKSKNWHFWQGLTHGFGPKISIFPTSNFLSNLKKENVFYDILERKEAFLHYKNRKSIKQKNWNFSKGVIPLFWSKNGHFSNFLFLINLDQENFFYAILKGKNAFLRYKNKESKKSKNWHFSKRG